MAGAEGASVVVNVLAVPLPVIGAPYCFVVVAQFIACVLRGAGYAVLMKCVPVKTLPIETKCVRFW
jgi:C4-dicarboxylate transporter